MVVEAKSRADMHCHSTASQFSKLGVQRELGLPECATPPEEVYELAKRRGMDFVTITDHDTIDGVCQIADRPDVFVSEELTAWFRDSRQAVHVLCYGITRYDHEWLQRHSGDVEVCAAYLEEHGIACALAHPFYTVEEPLTGRHRRRLAELFPVWETRNGARARELNMPAAIYVDTHGGTGIGGSDDHAGVDIGRTWTETPGSATPLEFLRHLRAGRAETHGDQGSAAKWAHAAMAIAARTVGSAGEGEAPDPRAVLTMVERVMREGAVRSGSAGGDLGPADAGRLLRAWLDAVGIEMTPAELVAHMQEDGFRHADLFRRARGVHERKLGRAAVAATAGGGASLAPSAAELFEACTAAIPYAPAAAFLGAEKAKLVNREDEPRRVAIVADGVGSIHGVTRTIAEIRRRAVPGFEVEVLGTDPAVDRRLPAVAEVDVPFYPGLSVGVPSLPSLVEALAEGRYDLVHLCSPGPAAVGAALVARMMGVATVGSYHTELAAYARLRSGDAALEAGMEMALRMFYGSCTRVLSPSAHADRSLEGLGVAAGNIGRWDRGVDIARYAPAHRNPGWMPGDRVNVLYAGRLSREKGAGLLAESFLAARELDPRLHLVLAGGGPEEEYLRTELREHATFLGWLDGDDLAEAYASADVFLFASRTDTFGQVILEAQASGLPVVAVAEGGPASLIEDGVSGTLCAPHPAELARAVADLAGTPGEARRLAAGALDSVRLRTWERSMAQLAAGYQRALGPAAPAAGRPLRSAA